MRHTVCASNPLIHCAEGDGGARGVRRGGGVGQPGVLAAVGRRPAGPHWPHPGVVLPRVLHISSANSAPVVCTHLKLRRGRSINTVFWARQQSSALMQRQWRDEQSRCLVWCRASRLEHDCRHRGAHWMQDAAQLQPLERDGRVRADCPDAESHEGATRNAAVGAHLPEQQVRQVSADRFSYCSSA